MNSKLVSVVKIQSNNETVYFIKYLTDGVGHVVCGCRKLGKEKD